MRRTRGRRRSRHRRGPTEPPFPPLNLPLGGREADTGGRGERALRACGGKGGGPAVTAHPRAGALPFLGARPSPSMFGLERQLAAGVFLVPAGSTFCAALFFDGLEACFIGHQIVNGFDAVDVVSSKDRG